MSESHVAIRQFDTYFEKEVEEPKKVPVDVENALLSTRLSFFAVFAFDFVR